MEWETGFEKLAVAPLANDTVGRRHACDQAALQDLIHTNGQLKFKFSAVRLATVGAESESSFINCCVTIEI